MSFVSADISMSLDGYVTGPHPSRESGLGAGGEAIQEWVFRSAESPEDRKVLEQGGERAGAVVMGRRTFDFVDGPNGWDDTINYAYDHDVPERPPVVVLTHSAPEETRHAEGFIFVTEGIDAAVSEARRLAGDREVVIMGGAEVIDTALVAGLVDRLRIHLSPVIMGSGTRLFDLVGAPLALRQAEVVASPLATHLSFDVR
ncbi:dihydrofolate reductase family protein [Nesterenkonia xinjiangensis]|uniref:Dihydrofolate reductase n=1 Tax=Nesterenkonia xinjiangensis TaxID=225327 RepID=A0A7Z0GIX3_9MICC|nr:dihydrofolate reductase family protein [Nesterenkonia xinjiangensis]NYJ76841.1 dihydrofolate reductase [Nesterenkonia xinjiangensis]